MKRLGNVFDKMKSIENLQLAFYKAQRFKSYRKDIVRFRENLTENLYRISAQLEEDSFPFGNYHSFYVYEPKKREVCTVPFPERVVHHAIINVCEPRFEQYQIPQSYACRVGKGSHKAIELAQSYIKRWPWYLKLDIHKYFDSVDHCQLLKVLEHLIKDKRLLNTLWEIIDSFRGDKGIPIGNLTSQHFGNVYLSVLDHYIKENLRVKGYARYMDDFICFCNSKQDAKEKLAQIKSFLNDKLLLTLNPPQINKTCLGVPFLGYRIFRNNLRLTPKAKKRFLRKIKNAFMLLDHGIWSQADFARHTETLISVVKRANADGILTRCLC